MLVQQITDDMKAAMKSGDKQKLAAIRMFRAALKDKEIELGAALSEEDVVGVAGKLIKQRKDAASQYTDAGRDDLAEKELAEAEVLQGYMPEQLSDDELTEMVKQAIADSGAESMRDMGKVMGILNAKAKGRADMGKVSGLVKQLLQG